MSENDKDMGILSSIRVLDLTDEKGMLCGKLLGDIGADVIKIEMPGGDRSRNIGPFYHDTADPEKSLYWFSYNNNKRGITLNIETADGHEIFERLVKFSDVLLESFEPEYMEKLGLGYSVLSKINPQIIVTSITPFGREGPYKKYKGSGIVCWALGGYLHQYGEPDRPPVQFSHHSQAYLLGAADGAIGTLMALFDREITGEGQHVDVSIQQSVEWCTFIGAHPLWQGNHEIDRRSGSMHVYPGQPDLESIWACKDGYLCFTIWGGVMGMMDNPKLSEWMNSEGMGSEIWRSIDWSSFDWQGKTQQTADEIHEPVRKFFRSYTKSELYDEAVKRGIMIAPANTAKDILKDRQLAAREFWEKVNHSELNDTITYPGAFAKVHEMPLKIHRRAPCIGEHNQEVYKDLLGLTKEDLITLEQSGVI